MYDLHSLQGQLDGIQDIIFCLNCNKSVNSFISLGIIFQILGPKCLIDSMPNLTVCTL